MKKISELVLGITNRPPIGRFARKLSTWLSFQMFLLELEPEFGDIL